MPERLPVAILAVLGFSAIAVAIGWCLIATLHKHYH
jgi:hypothetical protein